MEISDKEKLSQIEALLAKADKAYGEPSEFAVLASTMGAICGIVRGTVLYDAESDVLSLTAAGELLAEQIICRSNEAMH